MLQPLSQNRPVNTILHVVTGANGLLDPALEGEGEGGVEVPGVEGFVGHADDGGRGGGGRGRGGTTGGGRGLRILSICVCVGRNRGSVKEEGGCEEGELPY